MTTTPDYQRGYRAGRRKAASDISLRLVRIEKHLENIVDLLQLQLCIDLHTNNDFKLQGEAALKALAPLSETYRRAFSRARDFKL